MHKGTLCYLVRPASSKSLSQLLHDERGRAREALCIAS